jgi:hypothetical protein
MPTLRDLPFSSCVLLDTNQTTRTTPVLRCLVSIVRASGVYHGAIANALIASCRKSMPSWLSIPSIAGCSLLPTTHQTPDISHALAAVSQTSSAHGLRRNKQAAAMPAASRPVRCDLPRVRRVPCIFAGSWHHPRAWIALLQLREFT